MQGGHLLLNGPNTVNPGTLTGHACHSRPSHSSGCEYLAVFFFFSIEAFVEHRYIYATAHLGNQLFLDEWS